MRHLRFRLAHHVLLFPLDAAAFIENGEGYIGQRVVRREGFLVPVRDLVAEVVGEGATTRAAVHLRRGDEQVIFLVESAETIVDVDDGGWKPLPASLGPLSPWVDAVQSATADAPPAYRLAVASVWREFSHLPNAS